MPQFTFTRLQQFDNIELFASESENDYFPFHVHDIFCVSLITKGTEMLKNTEQEFMAPAGSISITQANEMHRNYALEDIGYSYQTLYINPELLKHFNNNRAVRSLERVIHDPALFNRLSSVFSGSKDSTEILPDCLRQLSAYASNRPDTDAWQRKFYQIEEIVESHTDRPINSDWLARSFCMSKYHFIREFKKAKGVTPQTYITLYRLGKARKMLLQQVPVNDVAYCNGFYDASHFIHHFKRYYGITPAQYARSSGSVK